MPRIWVIAFFLASCRYQIMIEPSSAPQEDCKPAHRMTMKSKPSRPKPAVVSGKYTCSCADWCTEVDLCCEKSICRPGHYKPVPQGTPRDCTCLATCSAEGNCCPEICIGEKQF